MAVNVRSNDIDQPFLMPPSIRDWLPDDHLAFFVFDVVSELDLASFYGKYRADGRGGAVYDPAMMLRVLFYAYCTGERSSRRIERRLIEDVGYRVVAVNQCPDHATLARFRRTHEAAIASLFSQVLGLCVKAGLVDTDTVAIDGTKIAANASFFANATREELAEKVLAEAEAADVADDELDLKRDDKPKDEGWSGGQSRRERIRTALEEIDREKSRDYESRVAERAKKEAATGKGVTGPKPSPDTARRAKPRRANTTDPHSRIIAQDSKGVIQGYNAQAASTYKNIIVAAEATATTNDQVHFLPMVEATKENLQSAGHTAPVGTFLADAGYWTVTNGTTDIGANALMPTRKPARRKENVPDDDKMAVLARVNRGELSQREAGKMLGVSYTWIRDMQKRYFGTDGPKNPATSNPEPEQWIPVIERLDRGEISRRAAVDELNISTWRINAMLAHIRGEKTEPDIARRAMSAKLKEPDNQALYKKRAPSIEAVFGNIKQNLGFRRFSRRGLPAVNSEWRLICTAHNLLKLQRAAVT